MKSKMKIFLIVLLTFLFSTNSFSQKEPEMILVKGSTFKMGNSEVTKDNQDESPVHSVKLNDFYIGKYEVTVSEYKAFIKDKTFSEFKNYRYHTMPKC